MGRRNHPAKPGDLPFATRSFKLSGRKAMIMALIKVNHYVFVFAWLCLPLLGAHNYVKAQELPTVNLEVVEIVNNRLSPFAIGASSTSLDSSLIKLEAIPNLADLITNYTSSAIKSYGNGMLSTISFRGTGASHTAVLWHGINISYPMLGQSDLSILSLALSDQVSIQHGTGSALYGSGALGGTVSVSNAEPVSGTNIAVAQWFGSFGTIKNNIRGSYTNDKFFIKIGTLWDQSNNNFKFKNKTKPGEPVELQQGADYLILGSSLESGIALGNRGKLSISGQYFNADRNLQPSMNANTPADYQTDENIRIKTKYLHNGDKLNWNVNYAYLYDAIGFNEAKTYATQQVFRAELERNLSSWLNFNLAADYNFIQINSPFYVAEITKEQRANIWASFLLNPLSRLFISLNLRQSFNPEYNIPFTPALGAEFILVDRPEHYLRIKTLLARGFRVPTLNEQYWQPGGNLNLEPEDSYSTEIGLLGKSTNGLNIYYELTGYRMWVDNWILWRPNGSYWSPENIKHVDVYGIEASGSLKHKLATATIKWLGNYAFTKSINRTGLDQYDRSVNKQLAYVPIHRSTISAITEWHTWSFLVNAAYTGERFVTADNEESLPDYLLLNLRLVKSFKRGNYLISGHANINNILNTDYQSIVNKAMPGINFLLGFTISYNKH
jgi:vitamin B12 transporter